MRIIYTFLCFCILFNTFGQDVETLRKTSLQDTDTIRIKNTITTASDYLPEKQKKWNLTWSGLVGFDAFWDTRKPVEARDGGIYLYPADVLPDKNGTDINARSSFNFVAMNTRLTLKIQAPQALGAKVSGMVEGWFMGVSSNDMNGLAMRHAFIKMDWKSTQLLLGHTWHPLFTERMFAYTVAGSAGAPFQPFARVPQIRVTQRFSKNNFLLLYLNTQRDLLSLGPNGASSEYLRQSAIPEMGLQYILDFQKKDSEKTSQYNIYAGLGFNYKRLVPRLITADTIATNKGLNSYSGIAFLRYDIQLNKKLKVGLKLKGVFMQNSYEYLMIGGYAIKEYDKNKPLSNKVDYDYTNLNTLSYWGDLYMNYRSWEIGIFGGYCKNLGSFSNIQDFTIKNPTIRG